jgi:hypothetical protein
MTELERNTRRNECVRKLCLYEIMLGKSIGYQNAVILTHRPGGPREMIDKFFAEGSLAETKFQINYG